MGAVNFCDPNEVANITSKLLKRDFDIKPLYTYLCPVIIFICFISITFNAILIGISRLSKVVNKSPILLLSLNLAMTDLIASLLNGIGILLNSYLPEVHVIRMGPCTMLMFEIARYAALAASALHLLALACVHYRGIVKPLHYRSTMFYSQHLSRMINMISIACWVIPLTIMIAWFYSVPCQGFQTGDCDFLFLLSFNFKCMTLALFALPLLLMSGIYIRLFIIIHKLQKSRRLNHERSTLSRGVISATEAGTMGTGAAVNLPELMGSAAAASRAAGGSLSHYVDDDHGMTMLGEEAEQLGPEEEDEEEVTGCAKVTRCASCSARANLLLLDSPERAQLDEEEDEPNEESSCLTPSFSKNSARYPETAKLANNKQRTVAINGKAQQLSLDGDKRRARKNPSISSGGCTCDNSSSGESRNRKGSPGAKALARANTVCAASETPQSNMVARAASNQPAQDGKQVAVSLASQRSSFSSTTVAPTTNSLRSHLRQSPTSQSNNSAVGGQAVNYGLQRGPFANSTHLSYTNSISTSIVHSKYEPSRRNLHTAAVPPSSTKALYTTLLILGTYFISYIPTIIMQVLTCVDYCPYPLYDLVFSKRVLLASITNLLLIVKSIIDPFIYSYRMGEIQLAISKYLKRNPRCGSSKMHNTSHGTLRNANNMSLYNNNNYNNINQAIISDSNNNQTSNLNGGGGGSNNGAANVVYKKRTNQLPASHCVGNNGDGYAKGCKQQQAADNGANKRAIVEAAAAAAAAKTAGGSPIQLKQSTTNSLDSNGPRWQYSINNNYTDDTQKPEIIELTSKREKLSEISDTTTTTTTTTAAAAVAATAAITCNAGRTATKTTTATILVNNDKSIIKGRELNSGTNFIISEQQSTTNNNKCDGDSKSSLIKLDYNRMGPLGGKNLALIQLPEEDAQLNEVV